MRGDAIGPAVIRWAESDAAVHALVLIGSRAQAGEQGIGAADEFSDWDFQVVTDRPEQFASPAWLAATGLGVPLAYVARLGRLGMATKISIVVPGGELDLVLIPVRQLRRAKVLLRLGLASRIAAARQGLSGLALVLRGGHRVVKGEREWGTFFQRVMDEFPAPRLDDQAVRALAEGFVCDYVSTKHKVERGEFLAAQRWLHHQLAEVNFQLLHELRQRRGEPSFPDARRIEFLTADAGRCAVNAAPTGASLGAAVEKSAATLRELMAVLVPAWRWPNV